MWFGSWSSVASRRRRSRSRQSYRRVHDRAGIPVDAIRAWVDRARIDVRQKPGVTTSEREEIKALKKELAEMKLANEIV